MPSAVSKINRCREKNLTRGKTQSKWQVGKHHACTFSVIPLQEDYNVTTKVVTQICAK